MKMPGSHLVHYVDFSGRCLPAIVHKPDTQGKAGMSVFWGPGSMTAQHGVPYQEWKRDDKPTNHSWHYDCPNEAWDE